MPAVMIGDTADFRSPHYHEPSDKMETLDLDFDGVSILKLNREAARKRAARRVVTIPDSSGSIPMEWSPNWLR
jgi:hypothetical protein